jgi:hypothetical protein
VDPLEFAYQPTIEKNLVKACRRDLPVSSCGCQELFFRKFGDEPKEARIVRQAQKVSNVIDEFQPLLSRCLVSAEVQEEGSDLIPVERLKDGKAVAWDGLGSLGKDRFYLMVRDEVLAPACENDLGSSHGGLEQSVEVLGRSFVRHPEG